MYVCLCLGITDHQIRETVSAGATSVDEVMYCTGAGTRCGTCRATVAAIVDEELEAIEARGACAARAAPESGASPSRRSLRVLRPATTAA